MNAVADQTWLKEADQFYAPVSTDVVDGLCAQYRKDRKRIEELSEFIGNEPCVKHFLEGNQETNSRYGAPAVNRLFQAEGAIKHLNADYWSRTLALTDVLDAMNNDRRQQWYDQIRERKCPEFEESTVRATLKDLLLSREKFFAERVDGIFRNLSREHVTNNPMGFRKRMIIAWVHGYSEYACKMQGYISDLRFVIAKFMGRETPEHYLNSKRIIDIALGQRGKWLKIDGGALRMRVYLKGTAHLEVHPDMAWRLNCVLAQLYPSAIPSEFRKKPERKLKEFDLIQRPLPFSVLDVLDSMKQVYESDINTGRHKAIQYCYEIDYYHRHKASAREAEKILQSIGGVPVKDYWKFDYNPMNVIKEIVASGCVPDHVSHQYYPTPENIALDAVAMAEIGNDDFCLEPSAGQGGLADYMPKDRTMCIEISDLHCRILEEKGYKPICGDFLKMNTFLDSYTRIVMNPPYSQGRWQAHLEHAFKFLAENGVLVAILPASTKGKELIKGAQHEFSRVYENEFKGTSISVVIVKVRR